jgi:hypothetical protein
MGSVGGVYSADITRICGYVNCKCVSHLEGLTAMRGFFVFAFDFKALVEVRHSQAASHFASQLRRFKCDTH